MIFCRLLLGVLLAASMVPVPGSAATSTPLAKWFGSETCPALDGLSSKKTPPAVKSGSDDLIVNVPQSALASLKTSMTVPWYVYDPHSGSAYSHVGGDSGVVQTIRLVNGAPPNAVPIVDLSGAHTKSGIKLGDSAASVVRALGKPLIINACGMQRYEYNDTSDPNAEPNDLDFTIKDGRVIEIMHTVDG
jgi:hypothetical protein